MAKLYNLARMSSATTGTGTITLGAAVSGFLTFALAGVADGDVVSYGIKDGANSEVGTGTYTASGTTLSRTVTKSTNSNAAINLSGSAEVYITLRAEDAVNVHPPQGRLTLQTLTPVMTTAQSAKTTIFCTPYNGRLCPIYDGTEFTMTPFAELSVATTDTTKSPAAIGASKVNDWFIWNDAGTMRVSHGPDWTNDTTRSAGTALVMANGILLNNVSLTNGPAASRGTYVGTTRSNASSQLDWIPGAAASGGTAAFLGVWNAYNRRLVLATVTDNGTSYTYSSATVRQARASAGNQVSFVLGLQEDAVAFSYAADTVTAAASFSFPAFGVGFDVTNAFSIVQSGGQTPTAQGTHMIGNNTGFWAAGIGLHVLAAVEAALAADTCTFDATSKNALMASIWM